MLIFTDHALSPPKVYGLNTCDNVDIYERPLRFQIKCNAYILLFNINVIVVIMATY